MPAPNTPSFYGPGSSVHGDHHELDQQQHMGYKATGGGPPPHNQYPTNAPISPPPSYSGHAVAPGGGGYVGGYGQGQGQGQYPQEPLQVYAHHGQEGVGYPPPQQANVFYGMGQNTPGLNTPGGNGYYVPAPTPSPGPGGKGRKDGYTHTHTHTHGHGHGSGAAPIHDGRHPRPGGEVVYVERERRSKKDDVALGFCAGCATACCCCGCVIM